MTQLLNGLETSTPLVRIQLDSRRRLRHLIPLVAVLALILAPAQPAGAVADRWTTHGPLGATVSELVIDPSAPATVYAGTGSGVFKTTDGGDRWRRLSDLPGLEVTALAMAPSDPDLLFAAEVGPGTYVNPVYKSIDGGATWDRVLADAKLDTSAGFPGPHQTIAIDPLDPNVVYIATLGNGVLKSSDGGDTWHHSNSGIRTPYVHTLAIDPANPQTLYAATSRGLSKTTDGGATWHDLTSGLPRYPNIRVIAIDPKSPSVVYVGGEYGMFRSSDAGRAWAAVNLGSLGLDDDITEIAISPSDSSVLYAADFLQRTIRSEDGGAHWARVDVVSNGHSSFVGPIAVNPDVPSTVYAGAFLFGTDSGVVKTVDAGSHWSSIVDGLTNTDMALVVVDPNDPQVLYAVRRYGEAWKSLDGGQSWSSLPSPGSFPSPISTLGIDPSNSDTLYAAVRQSVYRSRDGGMHWTFLQTLRTHNPAANVTSLIVSTKDPSTVYAGVYHGGFFRSNDSGRHWTRRTPWEHPRVAALAMDPQRPGTLYAALTRSGVFKTTDGGVHWIALASPLGAASLAIDPAVPSTVYVGTAKNGVYKSLDSGHHWNPSSSGLQLDGAITSLAIDPTHHDRVYAGVYGGGVFRTVDGGDFWEPFNQALDDLRVWGLAVAPDGSQIHAATGGGGVFDR